MSRRHVESITDFLIVAISPALIICLVGSLIFFLTHVFYDGDFQGRLRFACALFVVAAVLIARISIEGGREHASLFALPLSIVTVLSIMKYTDANWIIIPLVAFVWWSTDKLTWDCTVLDDEQDASGKGLLQTIGESEPQDLNEIDAESTTDNRGVEYPNLWQRWLSHRHRHHTPGVWVLYFGIGGLPVFGLGQLALSPAARPIGFLLLCIYVASTLLLLMTTSFLQMRRYLLQRRLPFTDQMASVWLGTGGVIVAGLMMLALVLPRPNTGYSVLEAFDRVGSNRGNRASRVSVGNEGTRDEQQQGRGTSEHEAAATNSSEGKQSSATADSVGDRPSQQQTAAEQQGGSEQVQRSELGTGGEKPPPQNSQKQNSQKQNSQKQNSQKQNSQKQNSQKQNSQKQNSQKQNSQKQNSQDQNSQDQNAGRKSRNGTKQADRSSKPKPSRQSPPAPNDPGETSESPSQRTDAPRSFSNPLTNLSFGKMAKWFYMLLLGIVVFVVFLRYGKEIGAAIAAFFVELKSLLARLFGGGRDAEPMPAAETETVPIHHKPFASFQDPFLMGTTSRYTAPQLVNYTFDALQAWADERNCGRREEQTPLEFATSISADHEQIGQLARHLAILYNQAAYAPGSLNPQATHSLKPLWDALRGGSTARPHLKDSR